MLLEVGVSRLQSRASDKICIFSTILLVFPRLSAILTTLKPLREEPYDAITWICGWFYVSMLSAVHLAWLVAWQYQQSRPQFGDSIAPFEGWDRFVGLMAAVHLVLLYGSPAAGFLAVAGFIRRRLRERTTIVCASILLGSVIVYVTDPFGALDWWFD